MTPFNTTKKVLSCFSLLDREKRTCLIFARHSIVGPVHGVILDGVSPYIKKNDHGRTQRSIGGHILNRGQFSNEKTMRKTTVDGPSGQKLKPLAFFLINVTAKHEGKTFVSVFNENINDDRIFAHRFDRWVHPSSFS